MKDMANNSFHAFYEDEANVSPKERAEIEVEVELIGKSLAAREEKGMTREQLAAAGGKQSAVARLEPFDYTEWRQILDEGVTSVRELSKKAMEYQGKISADVDFDDAAYLARDNNGRKNF
jgi:hypothetical protein